VSFETPEYTGNADGFGTQRLLDAIRLLGLQEGFSERMGRRVEQRGGGSRPGH
jgi:GDP-D-mannose dehydratase